MPENEFEKKVYSELQGLKFKPSETVWLRVEERIRRKKNRRVFVIIFLFAGLALLGYWQRDNLFGEKKTNTAANIPQDVPAEKQTEDNAKPSDQTKNSPSTNQNIESSKQNEVAVIEPNNNTTKTANTIKPGNSIKTSDSKPDKNPTVKLTDDKPSGKVPGKKGDASIPLKNRIDSNEPANDKPPVTSTPQKPVTQPAKDIQTDPQVKNDKATDQINKDLAVPDTQNKINDSIDNKLATPQNKIDQKVDSAIRVPDKNPQEKNKNDQKRKNDTSDKKWHAGLNIKVGSSNTKDFRRLFSGTGRLVLDYSSGVGGGGVSYVPAHDVRSRVSYGFGVFARKDISERFYLNLALNYSWLRTGLRVGNQTPTAQSVSNVFSSNASINSFYRQPASSGNKSYINNYHFLGVQSEIGWQFSNWPLSLNFGLEYSRLLGTNSLIYERTLPGYYQDKNAFAKNHLFVSGGLSLRLFQTNKFSVELSPMFEGSLTRVFKTRSDTTQLHYTNFGVRLRIISKK